MVINIYMEFAAFIFSFIICVATCTRYKIVDLKGKIYIHMVRLATLITGVNLLSCMFHNNNMKFSGAIITVTASFSLFAMLWNWMYLTLYLMEVVRNNNNFSKRTYIVTGLPLLINLIFILFNTYTHTMFEIKRVDGDFGIIFNEGYLVTFILSICSFIYYLYQMLKGRGIIIEKKQTILFVVPFILIIIYFLQYKYCYTALVGFGYTVVLFLIYLYSYNRTVKIDSLTRLPDGSVLKQMLDYRIGQKRSMIVAMITLDDFKQVNREYGYHNGNRFLKLIAKYMKNESPKQCLARYSGDKFSVIFDECDIEQVRSWCERILKRFEKSWELGKLQHKLSVCISLVEYPTMAISSEQIFDLLEHMNIYGKKNKRNQYIECNNEFKDKMQRRLHIASILSEVVQEKKMYVEYQPILEVAANRFTRLEALFRLKDSELGDVSPAEFFPIAEENGYIVDIGYILLEKVCQYLKEFYDKSDNMPIVSVNFYRQQIMDENLEVRVKEIIDKYQIPTENIAFELPESVFSVQYNAVKEQIEKLNQLGCRFYLDGFGNAFLDLPHLMELPFEVIKFNKNMIREAENNDSIYLLVSALTAVFEENGKMILGDGIESEHLKEMADLLFMDFLQGYYLCEPLSGEDVNEEIKKTDIVQDMSVLDELLKEVDDIVKSEDFDDLDSLVSLNEK